MERLRTENRALDEQVKLLVQTEQRFYRSQAQLDGQLVRLERLAAFALANIAPILFWTTIESWARGALVLYAGR